MNSNVNFSTFFLKMDSSDKPPGSPAVHSVIFHLEVCIQDKGELAPETEAGEMGYKVRSAVKFDGNERKNENIE